MLLYRRGKGAAVVVGKDYILAGFAEIKASLKVEPRVLRGIVIFYTHTYIARGGIIA